MTTENVTIVFTDLVDSTRIQSELGPKGADELRRSHFTVLRQAIAEHGGTEVKNLGDGLMIAFSAASAALACAVSMQQGVDLDGRDRATPISIRVGLASGEVSVEDDDYFGDPVIEASRICARCDPGQILASELVRLNAGRRSPFATRPLGEVELKGLPDPVAIVEVVWEPLVDSDIQRESIPTLLTDRGRFPFAGRQKEFEILLGAYQTASTGATRTVLLAGEPGIGKTRLTSELAERVIDAGGLVLAGRSDELVSVPYQPFVEALQWRISQPGGVDALGTKPGELVRLVPELGAVVTDLPSALEATADAERLALFQAVREWLGALSATQPLLMVLDDLHWADMGTLLMLRHIIASDPVPSLLVVATYRDTDLDRMHPLSNVLAEFHQRGDVERVALSGLDVGEVNDLMATLGGHELDAQASAVASTLAEETGGNPFFVGEVLRHLYESGAIVRDGDQFVAASTNDEAYLPEGIRQVVGRRLSALPETTQRLLSSASVIGARFDLELLAAINSMSIDDVLDELDSAIAAHLVLDVGVGSYQFAHALVRSTLHSEITSTRRARLHLAVAQALEQMNAGDLDRVTSDLAYHWGEVGVMNASDPAFAYARRAAELAYARLAPYESAKWYRVALERLDHADAHIEAELLYHLALADSLAGAPNWQEEMLDAARAAERVGDASMMASALVVNYRMNITAAAHEPNLEKIELVKRALASSTLTLDERARLTMVLATETLFTGDFDARREYGLQARALVEELDDPGARARVLLELTGAFSLAGTDRAWMEWEISIYTDGIDAFRRSGEIELLVRALFWHAWASFALGGDAYIERVQALRDHVRDFPQPFSPIYLETIETTVALVAGEFDEAVEHAENIRTVVGLIDGDASDAGVFPIVTRLQRYRERSLLSDFFLETDPAEQVVPDDFLPDAPNSIFALGLVELGDVDGSRRILDKFGTNDFNDVPDDASFSVAMGCWAEAAALVGHDRSCRALLEKLAPLHDVNFMTGGWFGGSVARFCALLCHSLGDVDAADTYFAEAVSAHEQLHSPPWLARTKVDWAERLLDRSQPERARELALSALEDIGDLDLTVTRRRAETVLDVAT